MAAHLMYQVGVSAGILLAQRRHGIRCEGNATGPTMAVTMAVAVAAALAGNTLRP